MHARIIGVLTLLYLGPMAQTSVESYTVRASELGTPPVDGRSQWWVEQAKNRGKNQVILPGPGLLEIIGRNVSLKDSLGSYDLLQAVLVGHYYTVEFDTHITTLYRFRITRMLHACSRCVTTDDSWVLPKSWAIQEDFPPLQPGEFYVDVEGGKAVVEGITLIQPFRDFPPLKEGGSYLILARVAPDGIADVAGTWEGIFSIHGDVLSPVYKVPSAMTSDLRVHFSSSLSALTRSLAAAKE